MADQFVISSDVQPGDILIFNGDQHPIDTITTSTDETGRPYRTLTATDGWAIDLHDPTQVEVLR